ncbi:MAG: 30S ribosome-binding factor RbfA [Candidatus Omnitrophota bacterium]|jgi:ribosome-binding factor A
MARAEKVAHNLKKEISSILHDELNDPRLGFITITRVDLTPDLRYARIFYSVLGGDEEYVRTREALDSALGFIRRMIGQRIRLRFTPELVFKEDRSSEYSIKIEEVLNEIRGLDEPKKNNRRHKKTK